MFHFALIGCGRIAPRHAENIRKSGKLVAVCDSDKDKADKFAKEYGAAAYYSIEDLLHNEKQIDVISICTPNGLHAEHSIKALQAGKHVLCEKPLCITAAAAWQLIETEKFSRKKLFVVKSARFNPILQELKKKIVDGQLGKIYSFSLNCFWNRPDTYYIDWRGKHFPDGGALYTQFSHYIDALLWMLGDVEDVKGFAENKAHKDSIEYEDTGVSALRMQSGVLGTLHWTVNTFQKNSEISFTVIAEKGTISLGGEYLHRIRYQQLDGENIIPQTEVKSSNAYDNYHGSMSHHDEVYQHLISALGQDGRGVSNAFDGLKTVEAIEKIYKAVNAALI
jgi:predicted dehydrogenase